MGFKGEDYTSNWRNLDTINISKNIDTNVNDIVPGNIFPNSGNRARNRVYRHNMNLFSGEYSRNKTLGMLIDGQYQYTNYKILSTNYFKLIVNKIDSLMFSNEVTVYVRDNETTAEVQKLIDRTKWLQGIRQAIRNVEIYGDSYLRTHRDGVSAFEPMFAYKVVDDTDKDKIICYILHDPIYEYNAQGIKTVTHVRILRIFKGWEHEQVFQWDGYKLGKPVRYKYRNKRWIRRTGIWHPTGVNDMMAVQALSVNSDANGVYGSSSFDDVKDLIFALERRISLDNWIADAHGKPLLLVDSTSLTTNEETGHVYLNTLDGQIMTKTGDQTDPKYITWDGKLESSRDIREDLKDTIYELTEMGRTFLSGEYKGNVSEESLNNIIKSAIDRANRELNDVWYSVRDSLYVLCKLNGIDVTIDEVNVKFNIGRTDDDKQVAEIVNLLNGKDNKILSKHTLAEKYFGYSHEEYDQEMELMRQEESRDDLNNGGV